MVTLAATLALSTAFASCTTAATRLNNANQGAPFYGMIYDTDGKTVGSVEITIDGSISTSSEINGRFLFDFIDFGKHDLRFSKQGYELYETQVDFSSRSQVAYIHLSSYEGLVSRAEKAISARKWTEADEYLARASKLKSDEPFADFLKSIIAYRRKDYASARAILESLISREYKEPYVYLFLADIYQYKTADSARAAECLERYLSLREDREVRDRLKAINAGN